ncbi:MFS transporter [Microbispora siamensis]|uniref:MFS transporter n=1 Tax=Microbispora siamensis TaxID=564413 RepID=A0ABQ4GDA9_9ACTN|nr:MFS transporter [Microbispora siamensis]GIH59403.1 MFS transporter [Microbispora siamensis]
MSGHPQPPEAAPRPFRKAVAAASIGNFIEWYDFALYGFFAKAIADTFFPSGDARASLLLTFAVFGMSFVVRPLGGLVFGHMGDRIGRRASMSLIVILISVASAAMALVPGYDTIGIAAPILIFLLRCVQGISAGGEWASSASYVVEHAPPGRRAFAGSWQTSTIALGMLTAALSAVAVSLTTGAGAAASWGWRVPFLVSLPLGLVGLYLRLRLGESPEFEKVDPGEAERRPLRAALRRDWRSILLIAGLTAAPTMCTYVLLVYGPTFLSTDLGMDPQQARLAGVAGFAFMAVAVVPASMLSDRFGRRPFLIAGAIWVAVSSLLTLSLMHTGRWYLVVAGLILTLVGDVMMLAPQPALFCELFPTSRRASGVSVGYNLGVILFGGAGPYISGTLVEVTASTYAPGWYLMGGATLSLIAAVMTPETLRTSLHDGVTRLAGGPGRGERASGSIHEIAEA